MKKLFIILALIAWLPLAHAGPSEDNSRGDIFFNSGNYEEAFEWYNKAAEQENARAQQSLGHMYELETYGKKNYREAFRWYQKSAEQGYALAQNDIARMYYDGHGTLRNLSKAYMWARISMTNGYDKKDLLQNIKKEMTPAQIEEAKQLAMQCDESNYKKCESLQVDTSLSISNFDIESFFIEHLDAIIIGIFIAIFVKLLGVIFNNKYGIIGACIFFVLLLLYFVFSETIVWYSSWIQRNEVLLYPATIIIAPILIATQTFIIAFRKYKKIRLSFAKMPDGSIPDEIKDKKNIFNNYKDNANLIRELAREGDADAQLHFGMMCFIGEGVPKNYNDAKIWFREGAKQGHAEAQTYLGLIYYKEDIECYKRNFTIERKGIPLFIKAYVWLNLGIANGDKKGKKILEDIEKIIPLEYRNKAQEMAKRCVESGYEKCPPL